MRKNLLLCACAVAIITALFVTGCDNDDGGGSKTIAVTGVTLNKTSITLLVNDTETLIATVAPATASNKAVSWKSSDDTKATVSTTGVVTAKAGGTATITVTTANGGKTATCTVTVSPAYTAIEGQTLVHYLPTLAGVNHFGSDQGTSNADGSYTFNGTAGAWSGGGAEYTFPTPKATDTWQISDYNLVEMYLTTSDGSVTVKTAKSGTNADLLPYPTGTPGISLSAGNSTVKAVISEAGNGIGLQRNTGGPATVTITKVVFSKGTTHTITFSGGDYTAMPAIEQIKIPDGRTVNFNGSYVMPIKPTWAGHYFVKWYNTTDTKDFVTTDPITKNITLTAQWEEGEPSAVDMKLNLDPSTWGELPPVPAGLQSGGWDWPKTYATTSYNSSTGTLTLTFNGFNRQRAIIPLNAEQIAELMEVTGVTFKIDADGDPEVNFRIHLADPTAGSSWNGTNTIDPSAPINTYTESIIGFSNTKTESTIGWFIIQAMYVDSAGDPNTQFPLGAPNVEVPVTVTIRSIEIVPTN